MPQGIRTRAEKQRIEFGDFQTPAELAREVVAALPRIRPAAIVEPTCGTGSFLQAASAAFPRAALFGFDVNRRYLAAARSALASGAVLERADFFETDWRAAFSAMPGPLLIIGNPPWVTNSAQGAIGGGNLPAKRNHARLPGIAARTGKSNFDVSESMLVTLLDALGERPAMLAMLCKTAVAQKVLRHAWSRAMPIGRAAIRRIDALEHFGASVDACLLICETGGRQPSQECEVFPDLQSIAAERTIGLRDGFLWSDLSGYERVRPLIGQGGAWRSGIKHDCSDVFELRRQDGAWRNGFGDVVSVEAERMFPLLKSSALAAGQVTQPDRAVIVTQHRVAEPTDRLAVDAPRLWKYLERYGARIDARASSIYRGQPRFSTFGIGPYTFSRWKVAVSGFYPRPRFSAVGPIDGKPVLFDDTCYFLPCGTAVQAKGLAAALNGAPAQEFFRAFMPPGSKRPLTSEILRSLDLERLHDAIGASRVQCDSKGRPRRNSR